ncbi:MAG: hypothetical protein AAFX76_04600 [Planctomycetota bacterium]
MRFLNRLTAVASLVLVAAAGLLGYQLLRSGVAADVYHDRLVELQDDHARLVDHYNRAVTRTAVTELLVDTDAGTVCVNVRTADGRLESHPVAADPRHPLYVDFVVKDQRLLIRRVFDSRSAPDDAGAIDSDLLDLDWTDPTLRHGQAIYRQLSTGRWIVSVSGDGSLALSKIDENTAVDLLAAPPVAEFEPVAAARRELESITPADVWSHWWRGRVVPEPSPTDAP